MSDNFIPINSNHLKARINHGFGLSSDLKSLLIEYIDTNSILIQAYETMLRDGVDFKTTDAFYNAALNKEYKGFGLCSKITDPDQEAHAKYLSKLKNYIDKLFDDAQAYLNHKYPDNSYIFNEIDKATSKSVNKFSNETLY